jgi:hypothetical protein
MSITNVILAATAVKISGRRKNRPSRVSDHTRGTVSVSATAAFVQMVKKEVRPITIASALSPV